MLDFQSPHRRFNPLLGEWILVSPHRAKRPWKGTIEAPQNAPSPDYQADCYLCPGNARSSGEANPPYSGTFVFTNDHAALLPEVPAGEYDQSGIIRAEAEPGMSRVICYTPYHNKTMADLTVAEIAGIVGTWKSEYQAVGANDFVGYVQIFENKGPLMGASSPHPHGQLWATKHLPTAVSKEQERQQAFYSEHRTPLLLKYLALEKQQNSRVIAQNELFTVLVPFWATWPYETMIIPNTHVRSLSGFTPAHNEQLAELLKDITVRYDGLFQTSFPYSMGIHQEPTDGAEHPEWQFHIHFYPPLLRSATIKKYFVGYEMLAEGQRDINPEDAAARLKEVHG